MKFFKNKNTSIRSSQGYSDVAAPGAGGSDPAVYRGFKRNGGCVLGHNIITVPNLLYGLKRCSGTFGSISDLKEGLGH